MKAVPSASRLDNIEARLATLEAREQIARLIARYGPAVDSGDPDETAALWSAEGTYSYVVDGQLETLSGRTGVADMVLSELHQEIIHDGAGHILSPPAIELEGDRAVAICYSMLVRHDPDQGGYYVWRLSANRWDLSCGEDGWRIESRTNELLDGRDAPRAMLGLAAVGGLRGPARSDSN